MKKIIQIIGDVRHEHVVWLTEMLDVHLERDARWLKADAVVEFSVRDTGIPHSLLSTIREYFSHYQCDIFYFPSASRRKKLLLADMDSTIVMGETLDDLAKFAGVGEAVSAITVRAMRGEIDFETALKERVEKLAGLSEDLLFKVFHDMVINNGARDLIRVMRAHGSCCVLVSGGFTFFTSRVAEYCGFSAHHGNVLDIQNGVLSGQVVPPILDKKAKAQFLNLYAAQLGIDLSDAAAIGDGANDLPMLCAAGLGVGYCPKPLVMEAVENSIIHSDLTSLLYMQGYSWEEIAPYMKN